MLAMNKFNNSNSTANYLHFSNFEKLTQMPLNYEKAFILIFGNDEETRFLFKTALQIWNYEVAEAENIEQCLQHTYYKQPDLILMDVEFDLLASLEKMAKLQACQQFAQSKFILVSGHAQNYVKQTAIDAGAALFLVKPVDFELLEKSLEIFSEDNSKTEKLNINQ